ncbi:cache domain-containing sensor histidine kinase [Mediterraneibacter massiliensis]|uniref:cache domain-containing sensor histidine kinase n=1 Tax=Mediterraneibacter massiliensis TaxID=1720300 RepID=UPI0022E6895B|nr:sensor histidine kinase [Mediterraneibacter massiliensis]
MKNKIRQIKEKFQSLKIYTAIMGTFTVLILFSSIMFFILAIVFTERSVVNNSEEYTQQLIEKVNDDLDSYINYMKDISSMIYNSRDIQRYLFQEDLPEEVQEENYGRILDQFRTIMNTRKDVRNVAVIADNGKSVINRGASTLNPYISVSEQEWYKAVKKESEEIHITSSHVQNMIYNQYDWVITLSRGIENQETKEVEGVFLIDMNYATIDSLCSSVSQGKKGYIYVLDKNGEIIYHPQQQLIYSGLKTELIEEVLKKKGVNGSFVSDTGNGRKLYTVSTSEDTGWTVVGVADMSELMKEGKELTRLYILLALFFLAVGVFFARLLSRTITRPIVSLEAAMKEVEKGHFESALMAENGGQAEIRGLGESFHIMVQEIQSLMEENVKEQKKKRKAEMQALQAQINPHFLYNTLDSIIWMAESGKHNKEVVRMTSALSRLFRQSIGNAEELVLIRQELGYIETYLTIQEMRYRDKLAFDIKLEEEIENEKIVKLTLQPLVENAIYHGIKYIEGPGKIEIRGYYEQEDVVIEIRDNGAGMTKEELEHIFDKKTYTPGSGGVGVRNVQNRLQLYYGAEYGLHYVSEKGSGTTVYVRIPTGEGRVNEDM